jgi:hypothetical protein
MAPTSRSRDCRCGGSSAPDARASDGSLWYEDGGYAPHAHLVLFDLAAAAEAPLLLATMTAWPANRLCAFTAGILSGRAAGSVGQEW